MAKTTTQPDIDPVEMQPSDFKPGDRIVLHGLVRNNTLNGQLGTVLAEDEGVAIQAGAVRVHLDLGPEVALKPQNLQLFIRASSAGEKPVEEDAKSQNASNTSTANAAEPAPIDPKLDSLQRARQIAAQIAAQFAEEAEKTQAAQERTEAGAATAAGGVESTANGGSEKAGDVAEGSAGDSVGEGVEMRLEGGAERNAQDGADGDAKACAESTPNVAQRAASRAVQQA